MLSVLLLPRTILSAVFMPDGRDSPASRQSTSAATVDVTTRPFMDSALVRMRLCACMPACVRSGASDGAGVALPFSVVSGIDVMLMSPLC